MKKSILLLSGILLISCQNFRIEQHPTSFLGEEAICTYVWDNTGTHSEIIWSSQIEYTVSNIDSISIAERAKAEKIVKSFEKFK